MQFTIGFWKRLRKIDKYQSLKKFMKQIFTLIFVIVITTSACKTNPAESFSANKNNQIKSNLDSQELDKNESSLSKILEPCENTQGRIEHNDCMLNELNKLNTKLNEKYEFTLNELRKDFTDKDIKNLKDAQRFWLSYRKANCRGERDTYGEGTDSSSASLWCHLKMTNERIEEIERIYGSK